MLYGHNIFTENEGGVFIFHSNATFTISGVTIFGNNFNPNFHGVGVIYMFNNSSGVLQGYINFVNNTVPKSLYGLVCMMSSRLALEGNIRFIAKLIQQLL